MFRRSGLNSFERPDEPAVCMPWFASMLVRTPSRPPRHVVPPHIACIIQKFSYGKSRPYVHSSGIFIRVQS